MNLVVANELALLLKKSKDRDVVALANAYLQLEADYGALKQRLINTTGRLVMYEHSELLDKLAKAETEEANINSGDTIE